MGFKTYLVLCFVILPTLQENGDSFEEETLSPDQAAIVEKAKNSEVKIQLENAFKKSQHLVKKVKKSQDAAIVEKAKNSEVKIQLENALKKSQKKVIQLEKSQGFTIFTCSVDTIKVDLEEVYKFSPVSWTEMNHDEKKNTKYPEELTRRIRLFEHLEENVFRIKPLAGANMRKYFNQMLKILNTDTKLWRDRVEMDIKKINEIQQEFRKYLGRTPTTADQIEFAVVVAQMRHGCNAYHQCFTARITQETFAAMMKKQRTPSLEYLLESLEIIKPWNITEKAVEYVNVLSKARAFAANENHHPITAVPSKDSTGSKIMMLTYPPDLCPHVDFRPCESCSVVAPTSTQNPSS